MGCDGGGFVWMLLCLAVGRGVVDGGRFCHHHHNCPTMSRKKRPRSGFDLSLVFLNKRFCFGFWGLFQNGILFGFGVSRFGTMAGACFWVLDIIGRLLLENPYKNERKESKN